MGVTSQSALVDAPVRAVAGGPGHRLVRQPGARDRRDLRGPDRRGRRLLAAGVAVTDAAGLASVLAAANAQAGSYSVTASVAGVALVALFTLVNTAIVPPAVVGLSRFGFTPSRRPGSC